MASRRSYRGLMAFPAWGLYDEAGGLVATIRAESQQRAWDIFGRYGFTGACVTQLREQA